MRQHKPSKGDGTPMGRWWALFTVVVTLLSGATGIAAQELTPWSSGSSASRPFREPPGRLGEAEAQMGLVERHRALRNRSLARKQRRREQPADTDAVPAPPTHTRVPPRPDAPGGEFPAGGAR